MSELLVILFAFFVQFTDKAGSNSIALSDIALDKRAERSIAIDSLDYAVSPAYIDSLLAAGCHIYHTSRWMNGASIETDSATIQQIALWSFVQAVYLTRSENQETQSVIKKLVENQETWSATDTFINNGQIEQLNLHLLHEAGYKGQGVRMAIMDGGFLHVDTLSAFEQVRSDGRLLGIYDTTDDTDSVTGNTGNHGGLCFGTIAAVTDDYQGAATEAEYYLIRSEEHNTESPKEMDNWVAGIELADSLGVDILSSSLGYALFDDTTQNLSYDDMDGMTTRCSRAATIAANKGMLVVVAAGNEGNKSWHHITAPADAKNILTVGAVNVEDSIAAFSSWGPTADGRVKPEVCATGWQTALVSPWDNSVLHGNGTSFACPIIAGMAACLWSALPNATNREIRERIIQSADRYLAPHQQYGYGIPDAWAAYQISTDIQHIAQPEESTRKMLMNGQLWILHHGVLYNLMGQKKG